MPVFRMVADVARQEHADVESVAAAVAKYADTSAADWIEGAYVLGAVRDPVTGVVTNPSPLVPSDAERAAAIVLSPVAFWGALAVALARPLDQIEAHVHWEIDAATALSADQRAQARFFMSKAVEYHRADENRDLLEAIAAELGLSPAMLDQLFIQAAA